MEKVIACCGLNCATCDARIATLTNNNALRAKTAEQWRVKFNNPNITPEMINCTGCTQEGVKFEHCEHCEIRNCVKAKGFKTCADCGKLESCSKVGYIHKNTPEALENLKFELISILSSEITTSL